MECIHGFFQYATVALRTYCWYKIQFIIYFFQNVQKDNIPNLFLIMHFGSERGYQMKEKNRKQGAQKMLIRAKKLIKY